MKIFGVHKKVGIDRVGTVSIRKTSKNKQIFIDRDRNDRVRNDLVRYDRVRNDRVRNDRVRYDLVRNDRRLEMIGSPLYSIAKPFVRTNKYKIL